MNDVCVNQPYKPENVVGGATAANERVRKVVSSSHEPTIIGLTTELKIPSSRFSDSHQTKSCFVPNYLGRCMCLFFSKQLCPYSIWKYSQDGSISWKMIFQSIFVVSSALTADCTWEPRSCWLL